MSMYVQRRVGGEGMISYHLVQILKKACFYPLQFVMETWKLMMEKDIKLSSKCYLLTIRALCKSGYLKEVFTDSNLFLLSHVHLLVVYCFIQSYLLVFKLLFVKS